MMNYFYSHSARPRRLSAFRLVQTIKGRGGGGSDGDKGEIFRQLTTLRYTTAKNVRRTVYAAIVQRPSTTPPLLPDVAVNFYRYDAAAGLRLDTAHLALRPHSMELVDITTVRLYDRDYLIVECHDANALSVDQSTKLTYLTLLRRQFRIVYESHHNATQNVLGLPLAERSCVAFYTEYASSVVRFECAQLSDRGDMRMVEVGGVLVANGAAVVQAAFGRRSAELIVLDQTGAIGVWRRTPTDEAGRVEFVQVQTLMPVHLTRTVSMAEYRGHVWLATCAAFQQNASHHGSVDVWQRAADVEPPGAGGWQLMQTIGIEVPIQVRVCFKGLYTLVMDGS